MICFCKTAPNMHHDAWCMHNTVTASAFATAVVVIVIVMIIIGSLARQPSHSLCAVVVVFASFHFTRHLRMHFCTTINGNWLQIVHIKCALRGLTRGDQNACHVSFIVWSLLSNGRPIKPTLPMSIEWTCKVDKVLSWSIYLRGAFFNSLVKIQIKI